MDYFSICAILKEYRKRAGLSQAALCEGLCELPTMNKIENGKQNPNKILLDALIQRLQIPLALNIPVTDSEFEKMQIENKIIDDFSKNRFDILPLLEQYKSPSMDKFEEQFYLYAHAVYTYKICNDYPTALEELYKSIHSTFLHYEDGCNVQQHLFTSIELSILNSIAICLYKLKKTDTAIAVMEQLALCLENKYEESDIYIQKYPMITYNLSTWLGITKQYEKSLMYSNKGIDCCMKNERYSLLSHLFYNTGFTLMKMNRRKEGKEYLKKSLALDSIFNKNDSISNSILDIKQSFEKDFLKELNVYNIF